MANVIVMPNQEPSWQQRIAAGLGTWMQQREEEQERQRQEEERKRQQQELYDQNIARQFMALRPEQQNAMYPQLPPGVQRFIMDPSSIPPAVPTTGEQYEEALARGRLGMIGSYKPDPFESRYGAMELITGRNPNADFTKLVGAESYMDPNTFKTYANEGFMAPSDVAKNQAAAAKDKAEAAFTAGPRTSTEYAQGGKYKAETGKITEETITERELRDPNSPATTARSKTAGRKSEAQKRIDDLDKQLQGLSAQESRIQAELAGQIDADRVNPAVKKDKKTGEPETTPYRAKLEGSLRQTQALIKEAQKRRDRITTGATKAGVPVQQPSAQPELSAIHPETKQRIISKDGGKTWVDAATGQPVRD